MQKQGRTSQTIVQPWGRILVPPQGYTEQYLWVLLQELKAPIQVKDGSFRLSTRCLEHCPVTSPPTNQKKVTHPAALTPNFAYKNFSLKTVGEFGVFEHKPPVPLAWPYNKPFSALNSDISVCLASLYIGHTNFCLVTLVWDLTIILLAEFPYFLLLSSQKLPLWLLSFYAPCRPSLLFLTSKCWSPWVNVGPALCT